VCKVPIATAPPPPPGRRPRIQRGPRVRHRAGAAIRARDRRRPCDQGVGAGRADQDHAPRMSSHVREFDDPRRRQRQGTPGVHGPRVGQHHATDLDHEPPRATARQHDFARPAERVLRAATGRETEIDYERRKAKARARSSAAKPDRPASSARSRISSPGFAAKPPAVASTASPCAAWRNASTSQHLDCRNCGASSPARGLATTPRRFGACTHEADRSRERRAVQGAAALAPWPAARRSTVSCARTSLPPSCAKDGASGSGRVSDVRAEKCSARARTTTSWVPRR
jgi:hypothetical protein